MSSSKAGVQAKIKKVSPRALYSHCYAHCLNHCIATCSNIQEVRNLIGIINESHSFLYNSPKRQRMFDVTVKKLMPEASHTKLPGLCKTCWVERHTCFEVFLELYEPLVTFLDAILFPDEYSELRCVSQPDGRWNWDNNTRMKAQGLKASFSSFQTIATFITKNVLDEVQSLSVKLQKRDQDVYEALKMVDQVIKRLTELRSKVDVVFLSWYSQILQLVDDIGVNSKKTKLQTNRSNIPSYSPGEHYRRVIAIPLLDYLITQLNERYTGDQNQHILPLLSLILPQ